MSKISELENRIDSIEKRLKINEETRVDDIKALSDIILQVKNSKQKEEKKIRKKPLSNLQTEILRLFKEGRKQKDIAKEVNSSMGNVSIHLKRMRLMGYEVDVR